MSMINQVQSHCHEGSSVSNKVALMWEGFVEKVCFEPKDWSNDVCCWKWRWWQGWADKWM